MPPAPGDLRAREIRLKSDALSQLAAGAEKAGEHVRSGHHGRPSAASVLRLRKRTGTDSNLFTEKREPTLPSNQSLAWIAQLHAERLGISWWKALGLLCEIRETEDDEEEQAAA